jgi:SAM-dependent methyltransferase
MGELEPTRRFSNRVDAYIRYRPRYPEAVLPFLADACGYSPATVIADAGSGTGILAELFLRNGNQVLGIEPNEAMREAAERLLAGYPGFRSVTGTAEATTLPDDSVDLVTAGQAFHWFDPDLTKMEFRRILRPGGYVALLWNSRQIDTTPFLRAYEELLQTYALDYREVSHKYAGEEILAAFFSPGSPQNARFKNEQRFDLAGLRGRLLSSSYAPLAGHPRHVPMLVRLEEIFTEHEQGGKVNFLYDTEVFVGRLN